MGAPMENKNAEKITLEDAIELAELAYSKVSASCFYLSSVAEECGTYREKFDYIIKKYNDNEIVFRTIKKMRNKCESIIIEKTGNGEIVPSLGIFVLKAYHGLIESSSHEHKVSTEHTINQPIQIVID